MKLRAFAAALAAVSLLAGAAQARDRVCTGEAEIEKGPSVKVDFTVDEAGAVKSRRASWSPHAGTIEITGLMIGVPILEVEYGQPTDAAVGAPARMTVMFMIFTDNSRALKKSSLVFELPDGRSWTEEASIGDGEGGGMSMVGAAAFFEATEHPALFADMDAFGRARMALRKGKQSIIAGIFDFERRDQRDQLFRGAWARAVTAAADPAACPAAD